MPDTTATLPELLTYKELSALLGRTVESIRNDVKHGRIPPPIRLGVPSGSGRQPSRIGCPRTARPSANLTDVLVVFLPRPSTW